jgi:hypothetical protein
MLAYINSHHNFTNSFVQGDRLPGSQAKLQAFRLLTSPFPHILLKEYGDMLPCFATPINKKTQALEEEN